MYYEQKDYFYKTLCLRCLTWFWIYLDFLSCFAAVLKGILIIVWYMPIIKSDYSIHSKFRVFPLFRSHAWNYNIKGKQRETKVKEKWWLFNLMFLIFLFLHCKDRDNKCYKQNWSVLFFTRIKLVARVLAWALAIARIKWKYILYIKSIY